AARLALRRAYPPRAAGIPGPRATAGTRHGRQPARLRLHEDARHPGVRGALRQRRRGQPRAEREPGDRALLHWHQDWRGNAGISWDDGMTTYRSVPLAG